MSQSLVPTDPARLPEMWNNLSPSRKIGLGVLVVAAAAVLVFLITWAQTPDYVAAFTDLEAEDGSAVIDYLKDNNIPYEITDAGKSIRVPANQVHEVRLALASKGIPGKGTVGFELFDATNLGMTDFTQQVNYQRALEGELARTIGSLTAVRSARVHVVMPQPSLFGDEEEPASASVVVDMEPGQRLTSGQVRAVSHLVASAVEGLTPDNLTVVDMDGNVLADGLVSEESSSLTMSQSQLESQRAYEHDLEIRIESMLENVLGPEKAVVRVAAVMDWDQVKTESETYLPADEGSVVRSAHTVTETYYGDENTVGGIPGTASNIPDAAPSYQTGISGSAGNAYQRADATTNYEVSRSVSQTLSATGEVKRLSVSVLVNAITDTVTLEAIRQATIAAAGIDESRDDVLTVQSLPFDRSFVDEAQVSLEAAQEREFYLKLAQWGAIALVLIVLFITVQRMRRSFRRPATSRVQIIEEVDPRTALLQEVDRASSTRDEITASEGVSVELASIGPPVFDEDQQNAAERAQMLRQLQLMAKNKPETLAQIIQFWLS